ncbi:helix-turn-helix domain-containing protein [Virgibacillus dakarensis]|nr:helix-turn-helix domain-containing protein [Virgibacillus dakarensis]
MDKQPNKILFDARKKKKLTHQQVASLATLLLEKREKSITRQYYGMIENGDRIPSPEVAQAIAQVLEIDWTIFFEIDCNHKLRKQAI